MNIIEQLEAEHAAELKPEVPAFAAGDTLRVLVKVREGTRERLQAFEGVCIGRGGRGLRVQQFRALGEDGCKVSLDLRFDMPRAIAMVGGALLFDQAADRMVEVFCLRAEQLHGA